ncbi:MAG: 50S ribosomal protein L11 methyltransferase, partial [Candidatus Marinimicrobia bacterium]|nr:50S ribosomal protein L11 methyltransferase [Candidatus Neomarinimicrobiota bacterium]
MSIYKYAMGWINLTITCSELDPRNLADFLLDQGGLSVSIVNTDPDSPVEDEWFDDPSLPEIIIPETASVAVLLPLDSQIDQLVEKVRTHFQLSDELAYKIEQIPEQDWVKSTRKLSRPQKISERLWIVPTWETIVDPKAINIRLDPGIAFGSGTHPSTRLCLQWLDREISGGERVLDYGSGSGILGIAALKLGAAEAVGVDIDPQANAAALENASINQVNFPTCLPEELAPDKYDIIIANILA